MRMAHIIFFVCGPCFPPTSPLAFIVGIWKGQIQGVSRKMDPQDLEIWNSFLLLLRGNVIFEAYFHNNTMHAVDDRLLYDNCLVRGFNG
jgi:hypothetical protein